MSFNPQDYLVDATGEKDVAVLPPNPLAGTSPSATAKLSSLSSPSLGTDPVSGLPLTDNDLWNRYDTRVPIQHENPRHRLAIMLKARGMSHKEIAERLGYTPVMMSILFQQKWAQDRVLKEINDAGRPELQTIFESAAVDSALALIRERDSTVNKSADRISAADKLLDRFLGKPAQTVKQEVTVNKGDIEEVDRELAELEREERRLRGEGIQPRAEGETPEQSLVQPVETSHAI